MKIRQSLFKFISFLLSFVLVFQSFAPALVLAAEGDLTPAPDVVVTQQATQEIQNSTTPSPTQQPTETPTPVPSQNDTTPTPTYVETPTPPPPNTETPTPAPSPTEVASPIPTPVPTPVNSSPNETVSPTPTSENLWTEIDSNTLITTQNVAGGIDYTFKDKGLTVRFSRVDSPGKLTIKEIKLSPEQVAATGAQGDTAYDITSDMTNGSFTYDLTLPLAPTAADPTVKFASSTDNLDQSQPVSQTEEIKPNSITIRGLDHFTIFFVHVASGEDRSEDGNFCNVFPCSISVQDIKDLKYDDEKYLVLEHNAGWPDLAYEDSKYVEFNFEEPDVPESSTIDSASLKFVYKTKHLDSGHSYGAKVKISSDGETWTTIADTKPQIGPATDDDDHSYTLGLPESFRNRAALSHFRARLYMFGTPHESHIKTSINQVVLQIDANADTTPPSSDPSGFTSSPAINTLTPDNTLEISWTNPGVDTGTGVDGYSYSFTHEPTDVPDNVKDIEESANSVVSSPLADGTWYFHIRTVDNAGNWTSTAHFGPFLIDATAPVISIGSGNGNSNTGPLHDQSYNGLIPVYASLSDANPSGYHFRIVRDGSTWGHSCGSSLSDSVNQGYGKCGYAYNQTTSISESFTDGVIASIDTRQLGGDGDYWLVFGAADLAGNRAAANYENDPKVKITVDNTIPLADLIFPTPGTSSHTFQVQFSEAMNPVEVVDPGNYFLENWPGYPGSGNLSGHADIGYDSLTDVATVTFTSPGWYISPEQHWGVKNIHDLAGNILADTWEYSTPMVAPTLAGNPFSTPNPTNSINQSWSWTGSSDPGGINASGVKGYWYSVAGPTPTPWTYLGNVLSATTSLAEGLSTMSIMAEDFAGNQGDVSTGSLSVDRSGPGAPEIVSPSDGQYFRTSPILNRWTSVTDPSGIKEYRIEYQYDDGHHFSGEPYRTTLSTSRYHSPNITEQGGVRIRVQAIDNAGNEGAWSTWVHYFYDATAPTLTGKTTYSGWYNTDQISDFTYTDNLGIVSGMPVSCTISTEGENQTCSVTPNVCDAAGNCNTTPVTSNGVNLDKTAPAIPSVIGWTSENHPLGSDYVGGSDFANFRTCGGSLNYSPMTNIWQPVAGAVGYDREVYNPLETRIYSHSLSNNYVNGGGAVDGQIYSVRLRAYDQAGNYSDWSEKCGIRLDTTAPTATINYSTTSPTNTDVIATLHPSEDVTVTSEGGLTHTFTANGSFVFEFVDGAGNTGTAIANVSNIDKNAPPIPTHLSPGSGAFKTTANQLLIDWSDVTDPEGNGPVTYRYQSSRNSATNSDGSFVTPAYNSGVLTNSQIGTSGTPAGIYYWHVRAVDSLGNQSAWSDPWTIIVDNTGPTAPTNLTTLPNPTRFLDQAWTWSGSTDSLSGVAGYWYRLNSGEPQSIGDVLGWTTHFGEGVNTFSVFAKDNSGNSSGETSSTVTVDTQAPSEGSLIINDGALYTNNRAVHLNIWAFDSLSGVSEMRLANGSSYADWEAYDTSHDWTLPDSDGQKTVRVRFKDAAGNETEGALASDTIILDRHAPTSAASSPQYSHGETIPVNFMASDANGEEEVSGVSTTQLWYRFNGGEWHNYGSLSGDSGTFNFSPEDGDGTYDFYTRSSDNAGNEEGLNLNEDESILPDSTTIFDTVKPMSTITNPQNPGSGSEVYSNGWTGEIAGTATDSEGSGIDHVDLSIRRGLEGEYEYWNGGDWVTVSEGEIPLVEAEGTSDWHYALVDPTENSYYIVSHAVDKAGNIEDSYKLTIILDKTIPEVKISLDPADPDSGNGWYKTDPTITLTATDNTLTDHIEYQWGSTNDSGWTAYGLPFRTPGEGSHVLYYRAFDRAGNVSEIGIKNIKYDHTDLEDGPLNVSVSPNPTSGNTAKVKWEEAKDNVGIEKYEINWSLDGTSTSYTDTVGNDIREHEINKLDQEGKWNVKVTAFDYSGNRKTGSVELTVDRTSPAAPTLTLSGTGVGTATLSWNKISDAVDYILWYGNVSGKYLYGARVGDSTSFTVKGLGAGDYYFVIQSVDSAGNRSNYSNEVSTLALTGAPGVAPGTPAEGFTPEVKGAVAEETPSTTPTPTQQVEGASTSKKNWPWWLLLLIPLGGGLYLYLRRNEQ